MTARRILGPLCSTTSSPMDEGTLCRSTSYPPGPIGVGVYRHEYSLPQIDDGLEIVLTPIQLAAVLNGETIERSGTLKDRFWGAVTAIGGALELVGATVLLLAPEPTAVTKVAGVALGAHGLDTTATGVRQMGSGTPQQSITSEAAKSAAQAFGVDEKNAELIGLTVDIGVPMLLGVVGAVRVLAIRSGALSLAAEESLGGHTIARHVARTETELRARLSSEPRIRAATSFRTLAEAEMFVSEALRANHTAISSWAKMAAAGQTKAFSYSASRFVGFGVERSTNAVHQMSNLTVVVRKLQANGRIYFVLTAYPKI